MNALEALFRVEVGRYAQTVLDKRVILSGGLRQHLQAKGWRVDELRYEDGEWIFKGLPPLAHPVQARVIPLADEPPKFALRDGRLVLDE